MSNTLPRMSSPVASASTTNTAEEEEFAKYTHYEHIRKRPDMYLGSILPVEEPIHVMGENNLMESKQLKYIPALYKLFDEIIVNAADNRHRDQNMNTIKVTIEEDGTISVYNNGKGIPIRKQQVDGQEIYVPELIFGHLLTSSNYNDNKERVTGGRNGYGAKLTNIFSDKFTIETVDSQRKLQFKQTWTNNMTKVGKATVKELKSDKGDYTKVTFKPSYRDFGLEGLDEDHLQLFKRRVYDLTATIRGVKVYLNGSMIPVKSFKDYIQLFTGKDSEVVYEKVNDRWEVAVAPNDSGQFQHVSFVNSINTVRGGTHVDLVAKQLIDNVMERLKKAVKSDNLGLRPVVIKNNLFLFVNCLIVNPSFNSQTKELLTTRPAQWGSVCFLSDNFFKKVAQTAIMQASLEQVQDKQDKLLKKTDGTKKRRIQGIPKLDDADCAGTRRSQECTLFLTEGDSAKTTAVQGISAIKNGSDLFGVYPLRGKVLNVRDATKVQVAENTEIRQLKEILGLQTGKTYTDTSTLRYGRVALFTDADTDGSHIKGLVINFFDAHFPSLLKLPNFLTEFVTPIVKCSKGTQKRVFYTIPEFNEFQEAHPSHKTWNVKYYKGLGTSTKEEAQDYFKNLQTNLKTFSPVEQVDREALDMVFSKSRADDRKTWLSSYDPQSYLDRRLQTFKVSDFINKDLIHFSNYDNTRSIPKLIDGLKPSQRKVLYTLFTTKDDTIKVAQLSGRVSEHTAYHHGEQSLADTIVGLAQDFCGSNNLNLLVPDGQFGSRRMGGADAASPRYIFTRLQKYTRLIFHPDDDKILPKQYDDNKPIEPDYYLPIIPMILVNGATGIGSGYSTHVPPHNPLDIIKLIRSKLAQTEEPPQLKPWYKGFNGTVEQNPNKVDEQLVSGTFTLTNNGQTLEITELPVGVWTQKFKEKYLEPDQKEKLPPGIQDLVKDYREVKSDTQVYFNIDLTRPLTPEEACNLFKLKSVVRTSNMVLADTNMRLKKYASANAIIEEYFPIRLDGYAKRKDYKVKHLEKELRKLQNRLRYINAVLENKIQLHRQSKALIEQQLEALQFSKEDDPPSFDYLLKLPMWSTTLEKYNELKEDHDKTQQLLDVLQNKSPAQLWLEDLDTLERHVVKALEDVPLSNASSSSSSSVASSSGSGGRTSTRPSKRTSSDPISRQAKPTKRSRLTET